MSETIGQKTGYILLCVLLIIGCIFGLIAGIIFYAVKDEVGFLVLIIFASIGIAGSVGSIIFFSIKITKIKKNRKLES